MLYLPYYLGTYFMISFKKSYKIAAPLSLSRKMKTFGPKLRIKTALLYPITHLSSQWAVRFSKMGFYFVFYFLEWLQAWLYIQSSKNIYRTYQNNSNIYTLKLKRYKLEREIELDSENGLNFMRQWFLEANHLLH